MSQKNFSLQDARSQRIKLTYLIECDKITADQCLVVRPVEPNLN